MKKTSFSLGLIIVSNILIIGISLVYGLHVFPFSSVQKGLLIEGKDEYRDLTIKKIDTEI